MHPLTVHAHAWLQKLLQLDKTDTSAIQSLALLKVVCYTCIKSIDDLNC